MAMIRQWPKDDSVVRGGNQFGQIPCLTDDGNVVVFEPGAILYYVQQHYGTAETILSAKDEAAITSWITWAHASLDPICFLETPDGKVYDTGP